MKKFIKLAIISITLVGVSGCVVDGRYGGHYHGWYGDCGHYRR